MFGNNAMNGVSNGKNAFTGFAAPLTPVFNNFNNLFGTP
jgi:hypothetical protein